MVYQYVRMSAVWLCLAWVLLRFPGSAEDWPQWRGPTRTGHVVAGSRVPSTLPTELRIVWRLNVGEGFASPVVADGRVYYFDNQGDQETLHALRVGDGKEAWRVSVAGTFRDEQGPSGPRCTPLVEGDRVYVQSGKGELQCLRTTDGGRIWRVNFMRDFGAAFLGEDSRIPGAAEHGYTAAPVISGDQLIACVGGTNGAGVVSFDKRTGRVLWKSQDDLAAYAAPMIATLAGVEQTVCFTVDGLIGLRLSDGRLLWRVPHKAPYGRNCATPVIVGDWVLAGSYRAGLVAVKVSATTPPSPGLRAEPIWTNTAAAINFSSPLAVGKHIYLLGPIRNILCLEMETGLLAWSKEGYITTSADVAHAALLGLGGNVLICTDGGELILIAADPRACQELGRAQICGVNWCNPAYADGRLYVRDGIKGKGHLFCVELAPPMK